MNLRSLIIIFVLVIFLVFIGFKTIKLKNEILLLKTKITEIKVENSNLKLQKDTLFSINNLSRYFKIDELEDINSNDIFIINEK